MLDELRGEDEDAELVAALTYAAKARIGPFRPAPLRAEMASRDMARLGRRGFDYGLARRILGLPTAAEAEALLRRLRRA